MPTHDGPPPPPKNTRRHPRFEMYASVELQAGGETIVLPARNISLGGVFLSADGHELGSLALGTIVEVMVFDALDESHRPVRLHAEVVRLERDGLALMWTSDDADAAIELAQLLETMKLKERRD